MESLFDKVVSFQAWNFIKKRLQHRCFPVKFAKFSRTPILKNICKRPVLENLTDKFLQYFGQFYKRLHFLSVLLVEGFVLGVERKKLVIAPSVQRLKAVT